MVHFRRVDNSLGMLLVQGVTSVGGSEPSAILALPGGERRTSAKAKAKNKAKTESPLTAASKLRKATLKELNDVHRLLRQAMASAEKVMIEARNDE